MISSNFNWSQGQADLLRRAARCAPLWGATGKTAFYERGCLLLGGLPHSLARDRATARSPASATHFPSSRHPALT